ncbi:MAG: hypothetical protein ACJAU5_000331 [Maricaulis maris]|jgi:hypothetical protein
MPRTETMGREATSAPMAALRLAVSETIPTKAPEMRDLITSQSKISLLERRVARIEPDHPDPV